MTETGPTGSWGSARNRAPLEELRAELGGAFTAVPADAADPVAAGQLIDTYRPAILVLNAGATPLPRPVQHHTWQTFSRNWEVDVAHVFHWTREALLIPLAPGSTVVTAAYAARRDTDPQGPAPTPAAAAAQALAPDQVGQAVIDLVADDALDADAYLLTAAGLRPLT